MIEWSARVKAAKHEAFLVAWVAGAKLPNTRNIVRAPRIHKLKYASMFCKALYRGFRYD